ncbi:hypothetical protein ACT01_07020 [Megasphaera hexanoica]|nr:hypothetical protein ACT01_07020 [Megasphaera hexanoica]
MKRKSIFLLLFLLSLFCFPSAFCYADTTEPLSNQQVVMSIQQYNRLKQITTEQEQRLFNLQNLINLLKQNSSTDKQTLVELQNQLTYCNNRLINAQNLLNQQNQKLQEANSLLEKNEKSLKTLTEQMDSLKHQLKVKERQNRLAWSVAGGLLIGLVVK